MSNKNISGQEIYNQKTRTLKSWSEMAKELGLSESTLKRRVRRYREDNSLPDFSLNPKIVNAMDELPAECGKDLWDRAISIQRRRELKQAYNAEREVIFDDGPIVLLAMADLHLGSSGVSYTDIDRDIVAINQIAAAGVPVAVVLVGDLIDNFIIGRLNALRMTESPFLTIEEWGLVDKIE